MFNKIGSYFSSVKRSNLLKVALTIIMLLIVALVVILLRSDVDSVQVKKNVIIIMADDLGWNDVSFHSSSEIITPNIDSLAYNGIILNNFRTPPLCSPSRSSLMTGKYPQELGMQHWVVVSDEPWGLGIDEKIMPQYFKEAGYVTQLIGKWHLGFFQEQYTPPKRGYDSFFGYLGPYIDYFDYSLEMFDKNYSRGYDMRNYSHGNLDVVKNISPKYATELFTEEAVKSIKNHDKSNPLFLLVNHLAPHAANQDKPMQAKSEDIDKFSHIENIQRRTLAAMIYQLDQSVGEIVKALKESDMLINSIIVFYSDNGAPTLGLHSTTGSNFPFRGQKQSGWEGGIRVPALIYAPFLEKSVVRNGMFFVGDLLPTLNTLSEANFKYNASEISGMDLSNMIKFNEGPQRYELVTIDDVDGFSSYILNDHKLLNGTILNGVYDGYLGSNNNSNFNSELYTQIVKDSIVSETLKTSLSHEKIEELRTLAKIQCMKADGKKNPCDLLRAPCVFDLKNDPCEENNLAETDPYLLQSLTFKLQTAIKDIVPSRRKSFDPNCDPRNFNNTWHFWQKDS